MASEQQRLLADRRADVARAWLDRLVADYPTDAGRLFGKGGNPFTNPVGATFTEQLDLLVAALGAGDAPAFAEPVRKVVRIRAIHDLDCRRAVSFPFALRDVLRQLAPAAPDDPAVAHLIDQLALEAFVAYSECREQLSQIRVNEAYRNVTGALRRLAKLDAERHGEVDSIS